MKVLANAGADAIHCSQRRILEPEFPAVDGPSGLNLAGWVKKLGAFRGEGSSVGKLDEIAARLDRGELDLVAVGRAVLQDPEWAQKVKAGRQNELRDYDAKSLQTYF